MAENLFKNTKASYFDDSDIVKYWVDFNDEIINKIVLPDSSIPIRILGGKGSGKTHILRYFSFQTQKIRAVAEGKTYLEYIRKCKYLGIYMSINGLALNRFSGHNIKDENWQTIFYYYINLEFIERFLKKIVELLSEIGSELENNISKKFNINSLFNDKEQSIASLLELVNNERTDIDSRVSQISMPFSNVEKIMSGISPIFSIENSFLEIIYATLNEFRELDSIKILFIIDEFENATLSQQKFYNSLLRHPDKEKLKRISIRIAGRLTIEPALETLDHNEKLLEGSEINTMYLEDFYKDNFNGFTKKLYRKRIFPLEQINLEDIFQSSKLCNEESIKQISKDKRNSKKVYLNTFKNELTSRYKEDEIDQILANIKHNNMFYEKMNIFVCYKNWNKNLLDISSSLKDTIDNNDFSMHEQQEKFRVDMIYQLFREYRKKYYIAGYSDIVKLSNYNPRIFLLILSNIYEECELEKIDFFNNVVSCKIQHNAILLASTWFWNNFTEDIQDSRVLWAVNEICSFFREARQSPKPSEKTLISFSYIVNDVSDEINELVDIAVYHSLLIEDKKHTRKNRNTSQLERQLRIHPMLSPKWELSLTVGGTTTFSTNDMKSLFYNMHEEWNDLKKAKIERLYPPFGKKVIYTETATLFDKENYDN